MIILIYTNIIELNWNYPTLRIIPLQEAIRLSNKKFLIKCGKCRIPPTPCVVS